MCLHFTVYTFSIPQIYIMGDEYFTVSVSSAFILSLELDSNTTRVLFKGWQKWSLILGCLQASVAPKWGRWPAELQTSSLRWPPFPQSCPAQGPVQSTATHHAFAPVTNAHWASTPHQTLAEGWEDNAERVLFSLVRQNDLKEAKIQHQKMGTRGGLWGKKCGMRLRVA